MTSVPRAFLYLMSAAALCGCVDEQQASIDRAYGRGAMSYEEKQWRTTELAEQRQAAFDAHARLQDHQPRGDRGAKLVYPQREDDDIYGVNGK